MSPDVKGDGVSIGEMGDLQHIYANGFQIGVTNSDVNLLLKLGHSPTYVIHMSYTLAKTLQKAMTEVVTKFESAVDREMLTTHDVDRFFEAAKKAETAQARSREE